MSRKESPLRIESTTTNLAVLGGIASRGREARPLSIPFLLLTILIAAVQIGSHATLISLPYFWDEAGYYLPTADDLFSRKSLVPLDTPSSGHPPLLSLYLSLWWALLGQSVQMSRIAMLVMSAVGLAAIFRLGTLLSGRTVGALGAVCTAIYPVYFAQSSMTLPGLATAAFVFLGLADYFEFRRRAGVFFLIAAFWKETALLVPLTLLLADCFSSSESRRELVRRHLYVTLPSVVALAGWYLYHWAETGFAVGNSEYVQYTVLEHLDFNRIAIAFIIRVWQVVGHMGLFAIVVPAVLAVLYRAFKSRSWRSALPVSQGNTRLALIVIAHVVVLSFLGGAVLARYLHPVVPLIILLALQAVKRRVLVASAAAAAFLVSLFVYPPYHYAVEENLGYRDFVEVHKAAAAFVQRLPEGTTIATRWPATLELSNPVLGFVTKPQAVLPIEDSESVPDADFILDFTREYEPSESILRPKRLLALLPFWREADPWLGAPADHLTPEEHSRVKAVWRKGPFQASIREN